MNVLDSYIRTLRLVDVIMSYYWRRLLEMCLWCLCRDTDSVFPKVRHKHKKPFDIEELWAKVATMADVATETLYTPSYITDPNWKTPHVLELEYGTCKVAWFYEVDKDTHEKKGVKKRYVNHVCMYVCSVYLHLY